MTPRKVRDRGEVSTQVIVVVPVIVLLLTLAVQAALVYHSAAVASAAAARGASLASGAEFAGLSAAVSGVFAASDTVTELGGQLASTPEVAMANGTVTFTVSVRVPRVAPFFPSSVTRTVIEPLERASSEPER